MARITVDDVLNRPSDRFELTLAAMYRARQLANGATPMVEGNKDKSRPRSCCARWRWEGWTGKH